MCSLSQDPWSPRFLSFTLFWCQRLSQLLSLHIILSFISSTSSCRRSFPLKAATLSLSVAMKVDPVSPPARAAKAVATVCLSRYNSCEEVWWRRVVIIKHCSYLQRLFLWPAVLGCPAGGPGGEGRTISCWKQPSSCSPHHPFFIPFIWEDCGLVWSCQQSFLNLHFMLQLLSQLFGIFNSLGHVRPESPCKAEKLSRGSVCGAVGSRCCAATCCGPVLRGANWAKAGPSCRALWTAQCCDPCSTPWGTPETEANN